MHEYQDEDASSALQETKILRFIQQMSSYNEELYKQLRVVTEERDELLSQNLENLELIDLLRFFFG